MTPPEEILSMLVRDCWLDREGHGDCYGGDHIKDFLRASLRERDARWGQAVRPMAVCSECDEALAFRPLDHQCRFCAPLRALLEEAGK